MNYRHVFHAGNFADLLKHAVLIGLMREMMASPTALTVIDTHAGAGLYDLAGEAARRTGEGQAGIGRLMATSECPAVFDDLKAAVVRANRQGETRFYPGSPVLIGHALRPQDRYLACELRPDDYAALKAVLPRQAGAVVVRGDGWVIAAERAPAAPAPLLVLIDPPFERPDDAAQAIRLSSRLVKYNRSAVVALWTPIKDLASYDVLVTALEDATLPAPLLAAQLRIRELSDPMRMNGCAMLVVNAPARVEKSVVAAADWLARNLGEAGGSGRVEWLNR